MSAKPMLCSFKTCPWVQRAAIVLRAKNIDYDITYIDRNNRPDWFLKISPHAKVPVLRLGDNDALFESNAISRNTSTKPSSRNCIPWTRLPARATEPGPITCPTFASAISQTAYSDTEDEFVKRSTKIAEVFGKLEDALAKRGNSGPYFNGPNLSLVDAAYAPFLQRYTFMDRLRPLGIIEKYPHLKAWRDALLASPAIKTSTVPNIEAVWQEGMITNKRWLAKFVSESVLGAAAA